MAATVERPAGDTTIRPFTVEIPEADLEDLRARIAATRFPEKETVEDDSQGVPLSVMQDLARYWATEYDWRKCEARLNAVPNFVTEIDGLDIHFVHVRSKHEDALPMVVCHGWPGSIVEQLKLIGRLTDPTAHGASASDAFHVVIPSMPGYGFSGKPTTTGWDPVHIGKAYVELMKRLGYDAVRRAGRRLGRGRRRCDGRRPGRPGGRRAGAAGADRHPHQHGRRDPAGALHRGLHRQPGAVRSLRGGAEHVRAAAHLLRDARGVRAVRGDAPADPLRPGGLTDRPGRVHARPRRRERPARHRPAGPRGASGAAERPHARRHPGQHHAVLADQHRGVLGAAVLGEQAPLLLGEGREGARSA